ncbi:MAG: tetratricopeptide repeat protein [Bacteroidota bacterium]|nr:tetratricopeptide repeat protein [Bacteroidota bacterium]
MRFLTVLLVILVSFSHSYAQKSAGIDLINGEMYRTAKSFFKKQLNDPLQKSDACYYLGEVYRLTGKADSASYYYNLGLQTNPENGLCLAGKAGTTFSKNEAEAEALIKKASSAKDYKKNPATYVAIAKAYFANNKADNANTALAKARDLDKKYTDAYITEGDMLLTKLSGGDAANKYEMAIYFDSNCKPAYLKLAKLHLLAKNYEQATGALDKLKAIDANYGPAYKVLGELMYAQGQYAEAADAYTEYLKTNEATTNDRARHAAFLFFKKDYAKSVEEATNALKEDPDNIVMQRILAYNMYDAKDYANGLAKMESFMKNVDPSDIIEADYRYYARLLTKNDKDSLAIINFRKALEVDKSKVDTYKEIAQAYEKIKKYADAAKTYETYVGAIKSPMNTDYFMWGRDCYLAGEEINDAAIAKNPADSLIRKAYFVKTDSLFQIVATNAPESHQGYLWRARANAKLDPSSSLGLAKPFYEKVTEILEQPGKEKYKENLVEAYQYLGYYYYAKDDKENAKKFYGKILVLDPTNKTANDVLNSYKNK